MKVKIFMVRDAEGTNLWAFRSEKKAEACGKLLNKQCGMPAFIDEMELDEEAPEPAVGPPHSVRVRLRAQVSAKIGEIATGESTKFPAHQAQWWAEVKLGEAFGDALQTFEFDEIEVLDEQGRRVQG